MHQANMRERGDCKYQPTQRRPSGGKPIQGKSELSVRPNDFPKTQQVGKKDQQRDHPKSTNNDPRARIAPQEI